MKTNLTSILIVFITAVIFAGCGSSKGTGSNKLGGTEWTLIELDGEKYEPVTGQDVTLKFNEAVSGVNGKSTCNTYSSACTMKDNKLSIGSVLSTKMACDDMITEIKYYNTLPKVTAYRLSSGMLYFLDSGGVVILRFKAK